MAMILLPIFLCAVISLMVYGFSFHLFDRLKTFSQNNLIFCQYFGWFPLIFSIYTQQMVTFPKMTMYKAEIFTWRRYRYALFSCRNQYSLHSQPTHRMNILNFYSSDRKFVIVSKKKCILFTLWMRFNRTK